MRTLALANAIVDLGQLVYASKSTPPTLINKFLALGVEYCHLDVDSDDAEVALLRCRYPSSVFVVTDGYGFRRSYHCALKEAGFRVVVVDDFVDNNRHADLIVNHSPNVRASDYDQSLDAILCLGMDYALLQPAFLTRASQSFTKNTEKRIFLNIGGADPENYTGRIIRGLELAQWNGIVDLVIGVLNPYQAELIEEIKASSFRIYLHVDLSPEAIVDLLGQASLAICPASTMAIEVCACRVPLLIGWTVDNQLLIYKGLIQNRMALGFGSFKCLQPNHLIKLIDLLLSDRLLGDQIIASQRSILRGDSDTNLRSAFLRLI
jgi:UDP-2,4-diacetamido-2,4,6-trideoxy-beta-L-altropyranose hydrolase